MTKSKIVKIVPNPFAKVNLKIVQKEARVNSAGYAMQNADGKLMSDYAPAGDVIQVPGTSKQIKPAVTSAGLNTGLNIIIDNPYKDEESYIPDWGEGILKGKEKVLLQHALEYKHKREKDYYTNQLWDRVLSSEDVAQAPFFLTPQADIILKGNETHLNLNNPLHEVHYYVLKAHRICANSHADLHDGMNTDALYYMAQENEVINRKADEARKINKAAAFIETLYNESSDAIVLFAKALGCEDRELSRDKAYNYLDIYFKRGDAEYDKFIKFTQFYDDAARRDIVFGYAKAQELNDYGVIRVRSGKVYWSKPEIEDSPARLFEWNGMDKFVKDFINAPEYQDDVEIINSILESRK